MTDSPSTPEGLDPLSAREHAAGPARAHAADLHRAYSRMLRWYPSAWRSRHGESFVAALMDQADAEGRVAPTPLERVGLAGSGMRERGRLLLPALPMLILPAGGAVFAALWIMAEAGRWYDGSTPYHVAGVAVVLGGAIAVARLSPPVALSLVVGVLLTQLVWGGVRLHETAWPMYGAVLVVVAFAAASPSARTRVSALVIAAASGAAIGALSAEPILSIGPCVAIVLAAWAGGRLLGARLLAKQPLVAHVRRGRVGDSLRD